MIDFKALAAPFPPSAVSWRVGRVNEDKKSAMVLAYLDARDVMDRLDLICGPGGWQCKYSHVGTKTVCDIGIWIGEDIANPERLPVDWVWKADGAGDTDVEQEKGALSDAFKRSAVRWGIGRYLYSLGKTYADVEPAGKSFRIKRSEYPKLMGVLERHAKGLPAPPDIVGEAQAIHVAQNAERAQKGLKPLRKPNPSRAEWVDYQKQDICTFDAEAIKAWSIDNAAKLDQLEEQNHSLYLGLMQAKDDRLEALRAPV